MKITTAALSSLLVLANINTAAAFTLNTRPHTLSQQSDVANAIIGNCRNEDPVRTSTRLLATPSSSSSSSSAGQLLNINNSNNKNKKRTTELNAATGISLSSFPSSSSSSSSPPSALAESNDGGLGVLFLNLGGPEVQEDVEGTLR